MFIDNIEKRWRKCKACKYEFDTYEFCADDVKDFLEEQELDTKYAANSLCWKCKNATGFCSWSREFEPVQGWEAVKTIIKNQNGILESYEVKKCPSFEKDKEREQG